MPCGGSGATTGTPGLFKGIPIGLVPLLPPFLVQPSLNLLHLQLQTAPHSAFSRVLVAGSLDTAQSSALLQETKLVLAELQRLVPGIRRLTLPRDCVCRTHFL